MPTPEPETQKQRGRPAKPEETLAATVVSAATRLMLERGYAAMTMEAVAKQAGVAKKTVYRFAPDREALFGLIVKNWTDTFLPAFTTEAKSADEVPALLEATLSTIADRVLCEDAVGLFRLLAGDIPAREDILSIYDRNGVERSRALLADWLARHKAAGLIDVADPTMASDLILSMVIAEPLRRMALGLTPPVPATDIRPRIKAALALLRL
ncbi:TetR/AcrR family transcriptional regulator [Ensifer sp. LC163]|uniref:TetR/AcrR family transcriptional regulator n=1 Tax=Ensifer sp. LC163 TaxID=1120652 RepID=UPI0008132811|nr:TetR/AcrR family transcriptional regulator [Ensifer sp. LC163]OCP37964.1 TetR family transcriptional regulator [Ensifer sp. LC163]